MAQAKKAVSQAKRAIAACTTYGERANAMLELVDARLALFHATNDRTPTSAERLGFYRGLESVRAL